MRKRALGNTGLMVSEIGFGGIPIQRVTKETTKLVLDECLNQGINFIDTARGYTISESLIGYSIKDTRDSWIIATKSMARDYDSMKNDIEISLRELKTDFIDLYQCHFVKTKDQLDQIMSEDGAFRALQEAKNEGKIGHIGITSHHSEIIDMALKLDAFETIQFPYNIVETQGIELFKEAHGKGVGVIIMKPIAGGAISNGELSVKYILNNPHVTSAIPGMESIEVVNKNALIGKSDLKLTEDELKEISDIKDELSGGFCRRCGYCLPCVKGIDIPTQFVFEGYLVRYNLKDWAIDRYDSQVLKADDCIHCKKCEDKCPYNLPISDMMTRVSNNFKTMR